MKAISILIILIKIKFMLKHCYRKSKNAMRGNHHIISAAGHEFEIGIAV